MAMDAAHTAHGGRSAQPVAPDFMPARLRVLLAVDEAIAASTLASADVRQASERAQLAALLVAADPKLKHELCCVRLGSSRGAGGLVTARRGLNGVLHAGLLPWPLTPRRVA